MTTMLLVSAAFLFRAQYATAQTAAAQPPGSPQSTKSSTVKAPTTGAPSDKDIADAKSKGLVWTNPTTKVYHKDGEFYGKTKNGKFMTEAQAKSLYYRPSPDAVKKAAPPKTLTPVAQSKKTTGKTATKADSKTKPAQP